MVNVRSNHHQEFTALLTPGRTGPPGSDDCRARSFMLSSCSVMVRNSVRTVMWLSCVACTTRVPQVPAPAAASAPRAPSSAVVAGPKQTIRYCSSTIFVWDAPYCVREVTPEQQRRRDWTRRLTYQDGRVVREDDINGRGELVYDEDD